MAGKITVQGFQQAVLGSKVDIFIDGVVVCSVSRNEKKDIPIDKSCKMTYKCGINPSKASLDIEDGMHTIVQLNYHRLSGKISMDVLRKEPFSAETTVVEETAKPVYDLKGARGRNMKVYEDKVILTTKVTIGSVLTQNATDGEKTIYFSDVLGVQFKKASLTIGYLQFETASSSMNNRTSNFFNENSFTFEENLNAEMEFVAEYVRKKVDEAKKQKNAPVVVTGAVSSADELKKFKELLDMGIITQEEFDAKKKQLLGL